MAKAKSKSKASYQKYWLQNSAAGLAVLSVAALIPAFFKVSWSVPMAGTTQWYYGVAMAATVLAAGWLVMKPKSDQAAGLLAVAALVVAVPGLAFLAAGFGDNTTARTWMHIIVTVGPLVLVNIAAVVLAGLAFCDLEHH